MTMPIIADGKKWRESKVRPIPGNSPHDRPVSRGISFSFWRICDDPFPTTPFPQPQRAILRRPVCVFKAWRNLSGPMWFQTQNQTLGWSRAASRWSAPSPGSRTCREDHAPSHRPQMSSGRLFLDRVGRHQSPSPLHRQPQHNMHPAEPQAKGDISTLPGRGHFYFALTPCRLRLTRQERDCIVAHGSLLPSRFCLRLIPQWGKSISPADRDRTQPSDYRATGCTGKAH
jgi:hypothetical protein